MNVVFCVFNRPEVTEQVFNRIAEVQPQRLLLVADGPRADRADDFKKVAKVREIISKITWPCEVHRNYASTNMGCGKRMATGLDWAFSIVEDAIILEDDCLPNPAFFSYCQELLERYRFDMRIMQISGDGFLQNKLTLTESYYFSKYVHIWGWATWRRAWRYYDLEMKAWPQFVEKGLLSSVCSEKDERIYWTGMLQRMFNGEIDTWDYPWFFACWSQNGLTIVPTVNLVSNIGAGGDATHTVNTQWYMNMPTRSLAEVRHPHFVLPNRMAERMIFDCVISPDTSTRRIEIKKFFMQLRSPWIYGVWIRKIPIVGRLWVWWRQINKEV